MKKNAIKTDKAPAALGPYSQGIVADNFIFVSGQLPIDITTNQMSFEIEKATRLCLENIKAILNSAGSDLDKVVKVTILLDNMDDFDLVNKVYGEYFSQPYPARATFEVARLPKNSLIEIECIAFK